MSDQSVPEELLLLRQKIDQIDEELMAILANRFEVTRQVGKLKAEKQLNSFDPEREKQKLERLKEMAVSNDLNSDFVLSLFQGIFDEVVSNHKTFVK